MSNKKVLLMIVSLLYSSIAFSGTSLSAQHQCYQSLIGKAQGANYSLENKTILLPGKDGDKEGFYLYSEKTAFFCEFPNIPHELSSERVFFYLALKVEDTKPIYMTYSNDIRDKANPGLSHGSNPLPSVKKYEPANCRTKLTNETRALLMKDLKGRISTVHSTFKNHNKKYMKIMRKVKDDVQPESYKAALTECSNIPELREDATNELVKFSVPAKQNIHQAPSAVR